MPFRSKAQLRLCYAKQWLARAKGKASSWDCDKGVRETANVECLPNLLLATERKEASECTRGRKLRGDDLVPARVYVGKRGGVFHYVAGMKLYVPKPAQAYALKHMRVVRF